MNKNLCCLFILIVGSIPFYAFDGVKDSVVLDEQVVTGTRSETNRTGVPFSVSGINSTEINRTGNIMCLPCWRLTYPDFL